VGGLAVVLALVAVGVGWWRTRAPSRPDAVAGRLAGRSPAPASLNLVVLTLDTLRADRLGCYGFARVATPNIDALAAEGVLFEQATSPVPLTFPSHATLFTGLLPPRHGIRDNGGFFLDDRHTTLAERLSAAGWKTGAFVGAWVLASKWGLAQGFETYSDTFDLSRYKSISLGSVQKRGDEVVDDALRWLEGVKDQRFFGWIHLYDPHTPYDPPEPFRSRYPGQPYVAEVAYTDGVVGRVVSWLRERGLLDRTLLVLTADHGESLGEHGENTHAYFVYDATQHVPLIVRAPWGDRGRVAAQVSGADVLPTILELLGQAPEPGIDGRSLALGVLNPEALEHAAAYVETYFPRYHFGWQHLRGLRDGRYKYVEAPTPELYDLADDPGETKNVFKAQARRADELRRAMETLAGGGGEAVPERAQLDPDTLEKLSALGYVGSVAPVSPDARLPDPKDKIGLFALMGEAKAAGQAGRLDEAIEKMRRVLAEDPGILDAHLTLGNWLAKGQRYEEAIAAYREVLTRQPQNDLALMNQANAYRRLGRLDAAIEGYRSALQLDAKSPQAWYQLAALYLDLGREEEARRTFEQALVANPKMASGYNSLAAIAYSRGDLRQADQLVRRALEIEPDVRTARFNLARIQEARGERDAAESLYRQELETYPDHGRARFNLAQLLGQRGDKKAFLAELERCTQAAPEFGPCFFFLARGHLDAGRLDAAAEHARKGLAVDATSELAPLGHYVLADVYERRGDKARALSEAAAGRKLEAGLRGRARKPDVSQP
jgi:arylsulfatase A-like enzyme/Flp pilus assembly protein TadD